mmetsp:Transcript_65520/g.213343  ORF Transcript_65520/g.213343 Transcript_65520/m.213343 type:complete len:318 (+) Transcript_65520:191-1144(+)
MTADRALYNHSKPQTVKSTRPTTFASIFASKRCLRLSRKALKPGASCSFMRSIGLPFNHSSDKLFNFTRKPSGSVDKRLSEASKYWSSTNSPKPAGSCSSLLRESTNLCKTTSPAMDDGSSSKPLADKSNSSNARDRVPPKTSGGRLPFPRQLLSSCSVFNLPNCDSSTGKVRSWFSDSANFCRLANWPMLDGNSVSAFCEQRRVCKPDQTLQASGSSFSVFAERSAVRKFANSAPVAPTGSCFKPHSRRAKTRVDAACVTFFAMTPDGGGRPFFDPEAQPEPLGGCKVASSTAVLLTQEQPIARASVQTLSPTEYT